MILTLKMTFASAKNVFICFETNAMKIQLENSMCTLWKLNKKYVTICREKDYDFVIVTKKMFDYGFF